MSESKVDSTASQDHWYVQVKHVDIPQVNYSQLSWKDAISQRILRVFAPTTSLTFNKKDDYFRRTFVGQIREYAQVRKNIKQLYLVYRTHRIAQLNEILDRLRLSHPPEQWDDEVDHVSHFLPVNKKIDKDGSLRFYEVMDAVPTAEHLSNAKSLLSEGDIQLLDGYCASIKRTRLLRSHLQEVEEDLGNYAHLVNTQATAELTYFRGLRDWCQVMSQLTDGLASSLIAVSTLGAGLVYATVFGAVRGDVGLMCYCFPFFSLGFLMPIIIQVLLRWGASLQAEVKFASQQFWTIIIAVFLGLSAIAVMASLTILNLTIFFLRNDPGDPTSIDPPTTLVPGIIAFSLTGAIFLLIVTGALLSVIAAKALTTLNGMRAVVSAMYGGRGGHEDALKLWLPV